MQPNDVVIPVPRHKIKLAIRVHHVTDEREPFFIQSIHARPFIKEPQLPGSGDYYPIDNEQLIIHDEPWRLDEEFEEGRPQTVEIRKFLKMDSIPNPVDRNRPWVNPRIQPHKITKTWKEWYLICESRFVAVKRGDNYVTQCGMVLTYEQSLAASARGWLLVE